MNAPTLASALAPPRGAVAVCAVDERGNVDLHAPTKRPLFEAGSLTKTMLGTLLAQLVLDGVVALETRVAEILGEVGAASDITLRELATHRSGLPRLAPDAMRQPWWPRDPYRFYSSERLRRSLPKTPTPSRGVFVYSNMGIDVLSVCLGQATGQTTAELLATKVFEPAGMHASRCQPCSRRGLARGHAGAWLTGARRWHEPIVGAGGVDISIGDLAAWIRLNLLPDNHPLGAAIRIAQELTWMRTSDGRLWHDGATGCFQSIAIIDPGKRGVGVLAAQGPSPRYSLTERVFELVEEVLRHE